MPTNLSSSPPIRVAEALLDQEVEGAEVGETIVIEKHRPDPGCFEIEVNHEDVPPLPRLLGSHHRHRRRAPDASLQTGEGEAKRRARHGHRAALPVGSYDAAIQVADTVGPDIDAADAWIGSHAAGAGRVSAHDSAIRARIGTEASLKGRGGAREGGLIEGSFREERQPPRGLLQHDATMKGIRAELIRQRIDEPGEALIEVAARHHPPSIA